MALALRCEAVYFEYFQTWAGILAWIMLVGGMVFGIRRSARLWGVWRPADGKLSLTLNHGVDLRVWAAYLLTLGARHRNFECMKRSAHGMLLSLLPDLGWDIGTDLSVGSMVSGKRRSALLRFSERRSLLLLHPRLPQILDPLLSQVWCVPEHLLTAACMYAFPCA
jgi:hypothetical protein